MCALLSLLLPTSAKDEVIKTFWCWRGASQQCRRWRLTFGSCVLYFVIFFFGRVFFYYHIELRRLSLFRFDKATSSFSSSARQPIQSIFLAKCTKCRPKDGGRVLASVAFDRDSGLLFKEKEKRKKVDGCRNRWLERAWLKLDAHVPIKPVHRPKTKRPLIVPISMYSCASSLYQQHSRNGR